jgi:hypothetical protein
VTDAGKWMGIDAELAQDLYSNMVMARRLDK